MIGPTTNFDEENDYFTTKGNYDRIIEIIPKMMGDTSTSENSLPEVRNYTRKHLVP